MGLIPILFYLKLDVSRLTHKENILNLFKIVLTFMYNYDII